MRHGLSRNRPLIIVCRVLDLTECNIPYYYSPSPSVCDRKNRKHPNKQTGDRPPPPTQEIVRTFVRTWCRTNCRLVVISCLLFLFDSNIRRGCNVVPTRLNAGGNGIMANGCRHCPKK
ncbi:hypothetical protein CDAR_69811 [Caerostris darwini]|uniref:Uncharacterized protein n=1 Tax=Caerostris darwini TaxID=1538125 RepID=A0AAV4U0T7_9ARAC|nr:hypothetical protein CDAR_69811 [Caerostris darwini]